MPALSRAAQLLLVTLAVIGIIGLAVSRCGPWSTATIATPTTAPTLMNRDIWATYTADPCNPPPEMAVDGMAWAQVYTWLDLNGNGVADDSELPLPGVVYWDGRRYSETDENGWGEFSEFRPGCACDCWEGTTIMVEVPAGYEATTPVEVSLTGENETHTFGFRPLADMITLPGGRGSY